MQKVFGMETTPEIIKRPIYLERLIPYVGKNLIKVLTEYL